MLGMPTNIVSMLWIIFQPAGMPGSVNWWWKPTGTLKSRNIRKARRPSGSETSSPPACLGTSAYQLTYAGQQPEVDDRVPGVPEERARQQRVDAVAQAERPGDQEDDDRDDDADRGEHPHHPGDRAHVGHQRRRLVRVRLAPHVAHADDLGADHQARDHDERQPGVEAPVAVERRVERVQHVARVAEDADAGDDEAGEADAVRAPHPGHGRLGLELAHRQVEEQPGVEEGREDERVQHAVERQPLVVGLEEREQPVQVDAAVVEGLERAERRADEQGDEARHQVGERDPLGGGEGVGGDDARAGGGGHGHAGPPVAVRNASWGEERRVALTGRPPAGAAPGRRRRRGPCRARPRPPRR